MTFGEVLERHEREIFAYALRLTGSRTDADDLYQETFLAAFRGWPPPRAGNERAWLYKIATNKAIDRVRRARRVVPLEDLRLAAPERDGVEANSRFFAFDGRIEYGRYRTGRPTRCSGSPANGCPLPGTEHGVFQSNRPGRRPGSPP